MNSNCEWVLLCEEGNELHGRSAKGPNNVEGCISAIAHMEANNPEIKILAAYASPPVEHLNALFQMSPAYIADGKTKEDILARLFKGLNHYMVVFNVPGSDEVTLTGVTAGSPEDALESNRDKVPTNAKVLVYEGTAKTFDELDKLKLVMVAQA